MGEPDGVATAFLQAWMNQNYEGMYSLLTSNSQAEYTLEEFTQTYESTASTMTLVDLQAIPLSSLPDTSGTTARVAFRVVYNTQVLGPITEDLTMNLVLGTERWGISWSPTLIFPQLAGGNSIQLEVENPSRANIYDRNGQWLVSAEASTVTISIIPAEISPGVEDQLDALLASLLRTTPDVIRAQYQDYPPDWNIPLGDADAENVQANWTALSGFPGIRTTTKSGRRYFNVLAPHLLGYTGYIPQEELGDYQLNGYTGDEIVGLSGLEKWGETYLAGTRGGVLSAYTPSGQFSAEIARRDPQPAQSLYTTLDRDLQAAVQDALDSAFQAGVNTWAPSAQGASVVVLDVHSGNVLAMASYPYFDPNVLNPNNSHPLSNGTYISDLLRDPRHPFFNRVAQGIYPPGSLFKLVTMSTALGSGLLTPTSEYTCTGIWNDLGANDIRFDWLEGGHGTITLQQALMGSCNPYFYHIGFLTGQQDYNLLPTYAREYHFGQELGLQIDEEAGLVPDPDWLFQQVGEEWTLSDSVNMSIGQGALLVSPLQMAVAVASIANGGTIYKPQLVDHIGLIGEDPSIRYAPEVLHTLSLSVDDLQAIREAMRGVASTPGLGTATYRLGDMQVTVAGKTGTAQVPQPGVPPIAWFGGYAPYDNPEIVVVVMVENGGQGSSVAAPIFRRVVESYFKLPITNYPPDWFDSQLFHFVADDIGE